ncbi:MAG: membrane protein insertase YidC [Candidatus Neomarinimicrobiota bacterium]|tara:strand:+ start:54 stop:1709 length:1656 start_codon:yes stop_codon:yes gene_type:complete
MNRKTLIGLILIGAILLFWPTYLSLVFPEENTPVAPEKEPVTLSKEKESPSSSSPEKRAPSVSEEKELLTKIQTPLYSAVISNKNGGSIVSFVIKKHLKEGEEQIQLVDDYNKENLLVSYINLSGEEVLLDGFWTSSFDQQENFVLDEKSPVAKLSFYTETSGEVVEKSLLFNHNSYAVEIDTDLEPAEEGILEGKFRLDWVGGIPLTEDSKQESFFLEGLVSQGGSIQSYRVGSASLFGGGSSQIEESFKIYSGGTDFAGYRTKYFGAFLMPQKTDEVKVIKYGSSDRPEVDILTTQEINFKKTTLFFGPLEYEEIANLDVGLEDKILGWQWLSSVSWLIYIIMVSLYGFIPNYGVVVILFAVLIKAVTYPLMAKQLRSTKKMQEIQPELNKIKLKYKSDPALQQQKMSALFQKSGVNPLAGCLPMLVQFPVLIAVFMVFRNTIEFRGEPFFLWITDLASPDTLFMLGSIPINVLPFLMSLSMFYTMKVSTAAQSSGGDPAQEATQKMMKYMFPGMMFFLFYGFPSGLNLYYLCFNVIQIIQQKIINKEK